MSAPLANHRLPPFALLAAALLAAGCSAPPKPEPTSMSSASSNAARDADPNAAAIVPLDGIRDMFEELWTALDNGGLLNWFDRTYTGALPETCAQ